ncbi:D-inositol-3-phosphate glycosyltransferase [subsurface metagenome]
MKKIGIDARSLEGQRTGVGRYLINIIQQWNKLNLPKDLEFILYFKKEIPKDIPKAKNFKKKILKSKSNALFVHYFLSRAAKKDKVDVLFCPAYVAPIFFKGKIALTLHDIIYEARPDLYNWPSIFDKILLKKVSKISAKKAKIIFTPSNFCKNEIIKYYRVKPEKIFVTPLATDIEKGKKDISHIVKGKYIFYIGSILKRRYIPEIVKAFKRACGELVEPYQFLIIGKNCINLDLNQKGIIHKEYIDEKYLGSLYANADLFIWLSEYEGFGLPPLEAMTYGTPVITTKAGSLPETVGNAALFIENPKNIKEIRRKINMVLNNKELREKLIKKGLEQTKKFSWQKTASETLRIMNKEL